MLNNIVRHTIKKILLEETQHNLIVEGNVSDFISRTKNLAIKEMERSGIPASVTMAQAVLESGWGRSTLSSKYNNYFGIKCHKNKYCVDLKDANGDMASWRVYNDIYGSFKDHTDFLTKHSRYADLFDLGSDNYIGWAFGLQNAGYAGGGNTTYAKKLIKIINDHGFDEFDKKPKPKKPTIIGKTAYPLMKNGYVNVRYDNYVDDGIFDNFMGKVSYPSSVGEVKEIKKGQEDDFFWYKVKLSKMLDGVNEYGWVREDVVELED